MNRVRNNALALLALALTSLPAAGQTVVDLGNGQTLNGAVEAKAPGFFALLGSTQYRVTLPPTANHFFLMVTPFTVVPHIPDLDLAIRFGQPVAIVEGQLVYDLYVNVDEFTGIESIEIPNPSPTGPWYIGIVNFEEFAVQYSITAMYLTGPTPTPTSPPATFTPTPTPTTPAPSPTPTTPAATPTPTTPPAGAKVLSTGSYNAAPGAVFEVHVKVDQAQDVAGGQFTLSFDPALLSAGAALTDLSTNGHRLRSNPQSGNIRVAFANALGAGAAVNSTLIRIPLTVNGGASIGQSSSLTLSAAGLYNSSASAFSVSVTGGTFQVSGIDVTPTATPTPPPTPTPTPTQPGRQLTAGTYAAGAGQAFDVLLRVSESNGIAGGECELTFDGGLLTAGPAQTDALTAGFRVRSNPQSGRIRIALANATGAGSGTDAGLVRIPMTVNAGATTGQSTNLTLSNAQLYSQTPATLAFATVNGSFQVSGTATTPTPTPTPGVTPTPTATPDGGNLVSHPRADINRDGIVDYRDQLLLQANWHRENPDLQ